MKVATGAFSLKDRWIWVDLKIHNISGVRGSSL